MQKMFKRGKLTSMIVGGVMLTACATASARDGGPAQFNDKGELLLPQNYREWIMTGAQVTPNELNGGKAPFTEIRAVYIDPEGFKHWKEAGNFKDGTMMVKELLSVGSKEGPGSGNGYFMGDFIGLEASVKDAKRFPNEPGNWAYYIFYVPGQPFQTAAKNFPTTDCAACHQGNAKDDMVFTQFYPTLSAAKGTGISGVQAPK
ncbi:MAG: cytochrome P460 family protein [Aestuariivirga sp.]